MQCDKKSNKKRKICNAPTAFYRSFEAKDCSSYLLIVVTFPSELYLIKVNVFEKIQIIIPPIEREIHKSLVSTISLSSTEVQQAYIKQHLA